MSFRVADFTHHLANRNAKMTLADALKGQKVTIISMNLTELGVNRLTALGLTPGVRVRVVDNSLKDASIIECRGSRLALGRGLARFIVVK